MKRKHHGRSVTAALTTARPAVDLWRAWADPERIAQWFVDRAEGTCEPGNVMTWIFDAFSYRVPVPILEAEPGKTLVTGTEAGVTGPLPTLMEIEIETTDGGSRLRLVNSGFSEDAAADDDFEGVRSGWEMALGQLAYWLEQQPPGARKHVFAMRPTAASADTIASLFGGAAGLARWLDAVEAPTRLAVGDHVRAKIDGQPLSGRVLAVTGREVLLEWTELRGFIGLKAFKMGPARALALDLSTWHAEGMGDLSLDRALERLAVAAGS